LNKLNLEIDQSKDKKNETERAETKSLNNPESITPTDNDEERNIIEEHFDED
jgi:hypothetical protein